MPTIEVNHVYKEFRLGHLSSLKFAISNQYRRLKGHVAVGHEPFMALDDVDFRIEEGEVVGIIGHNGAGKSTLLKLLAKISVPTKGNVITHGKVAPLIEVGAGLVPDFTGRENIYLNGTILGMTRSEIKSKFDEIVEFAELKDFIDTPLKRYSSGMQVRLGFSIATSVNADILIIDEVLAVGDMTFQRKCFDRMEEIIKSHGKTVLLVSHNIRQVERICSRAILMDHGRIIKDGSSTDVTNLYYEIANKQILNRNKAKKTGAIVHSSGEAELLDVDVLDVNGNSIEELYSGEPLIIRVRFELKKRLANVEIVIGTHKPDFVYLTAASTATLDKNLDLAPGTHEVECMLASFPLVPGVYCVRFVLFDQFRAGVLGGETLAIFSVRPSLNEARHPPARMLDIPVSWNLAGIV